jgi:hypothetical protein
VSGMNSSKLSARARQPGHDQSFRESEANFDEIARDLLRRRFPHEFRVSTQGNELDDVFGMNPETGRTLGVRPEATITHIRSGRSLFVEVKKQGPAGNAEERACKHHTIQFAKVLRERFGWDYHPFVTVFCDSLAVDPRYTVKFASLFEPENYVLWVDYDPNILENYLVARATQWLMRGA